MHDVYKNECKTDKICTGMYSFSGNIEFNSDNWKELKENIEIGDKVIVTDEGRIYPTYYNWFKENNINIDIAARYQFNSELPLTGQYTVVAKGKYAYTKNYLYAIEDKHCNVYIISEDSIRKVS